MCKGTAFIWIAQGLGVGLTIFLESISTNI